MMKKSTLLISAAMLALSTNIKAQTLTADTLQLQNPSFEEFEGDDAATGNHAKGWQTEGATPWTGKSQKSMPANTKGAWYVRAHRACEPHLPDRCRQGRGRVCALGQCQRVAQRAKGRHQ